MHRGSDLIDPFGRAITYIRVSVTDRCDFRCVYCMAEDMAFLPRRELLSIEELDRLCSAFIEMGTRKIRITGGEPLVRRDIMGLFRSLSQHLEAGTLHEMTLTTNGSQLARFADELASCGVRRVNVSLDTLDPGQFKAITRRGDLDRVLRGIDAAQRAGLSVKINVVALKGVNEDEFEPMVRWAHARSMGITFIEVMPLGEIETARLGDGQNIWADLHLARRLGARIPDRAFQRRKRAVGNPAACASEAARQRREARAKRIISDLPWVRGSAQTEPGEHD